MHSTLKVGDWVEVRGEEEILRTLDERGQLDGMPFMPEMFQYCGKRFQVYKRAHKTCDYSTQHPYSTRSLRNTVHLETRCDGTAHDGCQAGCLLYWKEAWLRSIRKDANGAHPSEMLRPAPRSTCDRLTVLNNTQVDDPNGSSPIYICQTTQIPFATEPLAWWDVRQYIEDYLSGNVTLRRLLSTFVYSIYFNLSQAGVGLGPATRWLYNKVSPFWGGSKFPRTPGRIPEGCQTPSSSLNLQPGELVRVKSHDEILNTVDSSNRNRGMYWDAELVPYCGNTYRVLKRVTRIIDEKTSKMIEMKTPCIILESVVCQARYSACRKLCPKSMYPYWREVWLERVSTTGDSDNSGNSRTNTVVGSSCAGPQA